MMKRVAFFLVLSRCALERCQQMTLELLVHFIPRSATDIDELCALGPASTKASGDVETWIADDILILS